MTGSQGSRSSAPDDVRPEKLKYQGAVNRMLRGVLRVPLLSRAAGRFLIIMYVTGRTTGRRYAIPVAYHRHEDSLLVGTPFAWGRNLRTGEPVGIRLKGRLVTTGVQVYTDEDDVVKYYGIIARANRNFAGFNKIGLDADGRPVEADLHRAWRNGARVIRLTPP